MTHEELIQELIQRKNTARQEREFHLQQAGVALGIEMECERLLAAKNAVNNGGGAEERATPSLEAVPQPLGPTPVKRLKPEDASPR